MAKARVDRDNTEHVSYESDSSGNNNLGGYGSDDGFVEATEEDMLRRPDAEYQPGVAPRSVRQGRKRKRAAAGLT